MKRSIILSILILASFLTSCEKQGTGKVTFYTNAQAVLNCGSFNVEVYINKTLVGTIKKPFLPLGESPKCNSSNSDSTLVIEKPEGDYEYTA